MNTLILGLILLIGLYICLTSFYHHENFEIKILPRSEIDPKLYLDNEIARQLEKSIADLDSISPYKPVNIDKITNLTFKELGLNDDSLETANFKAKYDSQSKIIKDLGAELEIMKKHPIIANTAFPKIKSIRSLDNSQPINLIPLDNNKHMIALNGQCLFNNPQSKTMVVPCNQDDPNQFFDLKLITNKDEYMNHVDTLGSYYNSDNLNVKYPFHLVKSTTGLNCLESNKSMISFKPCKIAKNQQWKASTEHQKCLS
jgi:hypothetical protein